MNIQEESLYLQISKVASRQLQKSISSTVIEYDAVLPSNLSFHTQPQCQCHEISLLAVHAKANTVT